MRPTERRLAARKVATDFVAKVNAETFCALCGRQPIEWHREGHERQPNARVSSLRTQGASVDRLKREMALCTPLCRSCHMTQDGRLSALRLAAPYQRGEIYVPPKPCSKCSRLFKPLRRGLCWKCSETARCGGRFHRSLDGCCMRANSAGNLA